MLDLFGDEMKSYEAVEAGRRFDGCRPVFARLDGRGFSKFTKGLERPFDKRMSALMVETTKKLMEESDAVVGYTQSDEITLAFYNREPNGEIFFGGKVQKMVSTLAAVASVEFNDGLMSYIQEKAGESPTFDCRVWQMPNDSLQLASDVFLWRQLDCMRNSVSMLARHFFSHKQLLNKSTNEMKSMLAGKNVEWRDSPPAFKWGTFLLRRTVERGFAPDEIEKLSVWHEARIHPDTKYKRNEIQKYSFDMAAAHNKVCDFLFNGLDLPFLRDNNG